MFEIRFISELKFGFNEVDIDISMTFNRTILELKSYKIRIETNSKILIINELQYFYLAILELKQTSTLSVERTTIPFNRTILELKQREKAPYSDLTTSFNRTILELKH